MMSADGWTYIQGPSFTEPSESNENVPQRQASETPGTSSGKTTAVLKLLDKRATILSSQEGTDFINNLGKDLNLMIRIVKQGKKKNKHLCIMEGSSDAVPKARDLILGFCSATGVSQAFLTHSFEGKEFSLDILRESIMHLDNPDLQWVRLARSAFKKIREIERNIQFARQLHDVKKLEDQLKTRYVALNAVVLGKELTVEAEKHMKILRGWLEGGDAQQASEVVLRESYDYVFKNHLMLNIDYSEFINKLPNSCRLESEIQEMLESGLEICERTKNKDLRNRLTMAHNKVIDSKYSHMWVGKFKKVRSQIKEI